MVARAESASWVWPEISGVPMRSLCATFRRGLVGFVRNETGAQVVEYALIIAVVSIAIVTALRGVVTDTSFSGFIAQIKSCLVGTTCGAAAPVSNPNLQPQRASPAQAL